jgi:hypothetical protein
MERINQKVTFSASSLSDKNDNLTFSLNDSKKKNGNEYHITEINKYFPEISSLCGK